MKKLAIAIPTYNRAQKALAQLAFLVEACSHLRHLVDIWVFDNCSTDDTTTVMHNALATMPFNYRRNAQNLGLMGNYLHIVQTVQAEYAWVVGDDDPLHSGVVDAVLPLLDGRCGVVHINHRCISGVNGQVVYPAFYKGVFAAQGGRQLVNRLLAARDFGGFMFITANVILLTAARDVLQQEPPAFRQLLAFPLYLNAALACRHGMAFVQQPLIDCTLDLCSWADQRWTVMTEEVPFMLTRAARLGISKKVLAGLIARQLRGRVHPLHQPWWVSMWQWKSVGRWLQHRAMRTK